MVYGYRTVRLPGEHMQSQDSLMTCIQKLAIAGEQAGFSIEDMISLLNSGVTVEMLLCLIENRLTATEHLLAPEPLSSPTSCWIM